MKIIFNKLINSDLATVFLFLYGLIVQIVSFPVIYIFITTLKVTTSSFETLVLIWYCIPVVAAISIIIAAIQINARKIRSEKFTKPLIGLILNTIWLSCYIFALYKIFVVGIPFLFMK